MKCERNCSYCEFGVLCNHPGQPEIDNNTGNAATIGNKLATIANIGNDKESGNPVEMAWKRLDLTMQI